MASLVTTTVAGTLTATSTTQPVVKAAYNANHYLGIGHHYIDLNYTTYTNDLELRTGGTARLTINRSTGAATFSGALTVGGTSTFSDDLYITTDQNIHWSGNYSFITGNGANTTGYLKFYTSDTPRLTIAGGGAATFSGNVTLNSSLTFSYNNYYFEAGTGSIYLKNASGNTVLGMKDAELVVPGVATFNGYIELDAGLKDKDGSFGTNGYVLTTDGSGDVTWAASPGAGSVTGTGTNNYIASWNGTTALETANIYKHAYGTIINSNFLSSYATNRHVFEVAGNPGTGDFDGGIINLRVASNTNNERVGQLAFINSANANHVNPNSTIGSRIAQIISTVATSDSNAGDDSGGDLQFWTKPEAGVPAERMRISSAGLFGIGSDPMANSRLRIAGETYPLRVATGSTEYYFAANVLYANSTNGMYLVNQSSYLRFGASNAEIMRLVGTGNGSVGIGTTSPGGVSKLEVQRNPARTTAFNAGDGDTWHDVIVRNPTNSSNAASGITFVMNNTYHKNAGAGIAAISGGSDYMASLAFITRPNGAVAAERMRIQYDGKVGINTNSPIKSLDVRWSSSDTTVATGNGLSGGNAGEGMLLLNTYNGTGIYANLDFRAYDADARIAVERTSSGNQSNMHFITDNSSNFDTRMFIQYDGNVGIGATSPQTDLQIGDYTDAAETITIATSQNGTGRINFYDNNNTEGGSIRVTGETSGSKMHFANRWTNDSTEITFDLVNGRVGIGNDAPRTKLEIIQNGAFASGQSVALQIASALQAFGGNNDMRLYFHEAGTTYRGMMGYAHAGSTYMGIWDNSSNLNPTLVCQSGEVGIGTTAPGKKLHVYSGASGVGASSDVNMILEGASNVGLAMLAPNNQGSRIEFGSVADNNEGIIYYNNTGSYFSIYTNGTRQVDITSAGNVGIGQAAPRNPLEVDLNQSNGTLTGDSAAHFGGQHHTSGEIMGITLGYREANDSYRKVGIVAEGLGDGAARQNFHILVNTANSAASCSLADKKLSIYGATGIIRVHNKFGIGGDPGAHHLYAAGSAFITGSVGIGTATPAEKLDVNGNIMTTGASTNTGYDRYLKLYGNTQPASNPHRWAGMAVYNNGGNNVNALAFFTGTGDSARTEKVRIHNDGKVGIGSTTPIRQLDVLGAVAGQYSAALINTSATGHGLYIKAAPNNASYMALAVDDKDGATILVARADKRVGVGLNAPIAPIHTCLGPVANTANTIVAYFGGGSSGNQYGSFIARVARSSSTSNVGVTNNESYVDIEVNSGGSGPFRWGTYDDVNIVTGAHGGSTGAYGNLNFVTGTGSNTKAIAMTIGGGTQGGKVGIGTTAPSAKLHAILDSAATNTPTDVLRLGHTSTGNTAVGFGALIRFDAERTGSTTDGMGKLGFVADTMTSSRVDGAFIVQTGLDGSYTERLRIHSNGKMETNGSSGYGYVMHRVNGTLMGYVGDGGSLSVSPTNATTDFVMRAVGKLAFLTNNSTTAKMTILADGKVGIGTASPSAPLDVVTPANSTLYAARLTQSNTSNGDGLYVNIGSTSANDYVATFRSGDNNLFDVKGNGQVGVNQPSPAGTFHIVAKSGTTGLMTVGAASNNIAHFYTSASATALVIDSGGKVGIGTTTPDSLGLNIARASTDPTASYTGNSQLVIGLVGSTTHKLAISRDTDGNNAYIHSYQDGVGAKNLILQPGGGKIGIVETAPVSGLVVRTDDVDATPSANVSQYSLNIHGNGVSDGEEIGLAFSAWASGGSLTTSYTPGAAIVHERSGSNSKGHLHFRVKGSTTANATLTTAMTILDNGNVGIGTASPAGPLHVYDDYAGERNLYFDNHNASGVMQLNIRAGTGNEYLSLVRTTTSASLLVATDPFYIKHYHSSAWHNSIVVAADGKIGMGTASPDNPLEVVGADSGIKISSALSNRPQLRLECGTTEKMIFSANSLYGAIGDSSDLNRYMAFKDGKVGIGETSPGYKLTVNGDFKVESDATFDGSVYVRNANNNAILLGKGTRWGYSTAYRAVQIGDASGNHTVCIGYDPAGNSGSSFTGDGREMLFRNGITFVTPNAGNTNWHHTLTLKDGLVGIGDTSPDYKLDVDGTFGAAGAATFGGSVTANSTLSVGDDFTAVGNCQLGNSYSDSHTVYGQTTFLEEGLNPEPDIIYLRNTTNGGKASIRFGDHATQGQSGYFRYAHSDSHSNGTGNSFHFDSSETSTAVIIDQTTGDSGFYVGDGTTLGNTNYMVALRGNNDSYLMGGDVGIGTRSPTNCKLHVYDGNVKIFQQTATAELLIGSGATGAAALILDASNGDGAGADYFYIQQNNDLTTDIGTASSGGVVKLRSKGSLAQTLDGTKTTFSGVMVLGNIQSSVIPSADSTYQLGDNTSRWSSLFADTLYGAGSNITALNGSNISSGQVAAARLGSGSSIESKFLRGDNTWQTVSSGSGDITEVIAGTTLSGGGASGSVTINHANHTGEVTGSGYLTIAGNVVDEANLKVSNSPTNGYVLTARSGNTGGMTWEAASGGGGSGTVTSVASGTGLTGGTITTSGTLSVTGAVAMSFPMGNASGTATPSSNEIVCYGGGTITVSTNGGNHITWTDSSSSDYRLKSNISTFNSEAWTKVKSVNLRRFDFDEGLLNPKLSTITNKVGFIAHELAEAGIEGAVEGTKDEVDSDGNPVYQKVCHAKLVPVMWGALKEAIARIETLETKVQTLENS